MSAILPRTAAELRRRDEEDTAAVLAVLAALSATPEPEPAAASSIWSDPAYRLGRPLPGGSSWWASAHRRGRS